MNKSEKFLQSAMGKEAYESLLKHDIYKLNTNTAVSEKELFDALQVVPAAILAFLKKELLPMKEGEGKVINLPMDDAHMDVTKNGMDVYSGSIYQYGKFLAQFKFRPLPSVGLVLLTTFELYDVSKFDAKASDEERSTLAGKIENAVMANGQIKRDQKEEETKPLKNFLNKKVEKKEFEIINLTKSDSVRCPDCGSGLVSEGIWIKGCYCLGEDRSKKVYLTKSENRTVVRFSKNWDPDNIQMVLELLRKKNE